MSFDERVLGIETSCDETAASVVAAGRDVLSSVVSSQIDLHARFGGVVPEIASRAHLDLLVPVVAEAMLLAGLEGPDAAAVACTVGPGLIGSLLVGLSHAKALALVWDVPFVGVNHLEGHLYASILEEPDLALPAIVLLVSGGHSMLVLMEAPGRYRLLGQTIDDAAGEAFDKVARFLGLGYPGGPAIDSLARSGDPAAVAFPRGLRGEGYDFSFSGLKTSVITYVRKHPEVDVADIAASFQEAVVDVLVTKALAAARDGSQGDLSRRRRGRQLLAPGADPDRVRGGGAGRVPAQPGHVHRQCGDDRNCGLVASAVRRPHRSRRRRRSQPSPRASHLTGSGPQGCSAS